MPPLVVVTGQVLSGGFSVISEPVNDPVFWRGPMGTYGTALALVDTQVNILPLIRYNRISNTGSDFPAAAVLAAGEMYSHRRFSHVTGF